MRIQFPGQQVTEGAAIAATVQNGILVEVRQRSELERLIDLCGEIGFPASWTFGPGRQRLLPVNFNADPFSVLIGALMAGTLSSQQANDSPEEPDQVGQRLLNVAASPEKPFDGLVIALATSYELWPADDDLTVLLGLGFPAGKGADEVSLELAKAHAALWMAPGSLLAGISVGTALKAAKWCALVAKPFTATTADAASRRLVQRLRDLAQASSRHPAIPRLDALIANDRTMIQRRPVLLVLLHGLFGTDLKTFDGFISQLQQSTPKEILGSLYQLQSGGGIEQLRAPLEETGVDCERLLRVSDIELRQFVDANFALVGWPHDSLAPIDTSAIKLAALLDKELRSAPPRHIVFVCHSQGGLLARRTSMQLMKMKSPANWVDRIGGIVTFGTPHQGAAIAEPGFQNGREAAVYMMMLNGTRKATSIGDVLTLISERAAEGIEDLKASTRRPMPARTRSRPSCWIRSRNSSGPTAQIGPTCSSWEARCPRHKKPCGGASWLRA